MAQGQATFGSWSEFVSNYNRLAHEGKTREEIAKFFNTTTGSLGVKCNAAKKYGIPLAQVARAGRTMTSKVDLDAIRAASLAQIAELGLQVAGEKPQVATPTKPPVTQEVSASEAIDEALHEVEAGLQASLDSVHAAEALVSNVPC